MAGRKFPEQRIIGVEYGPRRLFPKPFIRESGDPPEDTVCDHMSSAPGPRKMLGGTFCKNCGAKIRSTVEDDEAQERFRERMHVSLTTKRKSYHHGEEPKR